MGLQIRPSSTPAGPSLRCSASESMAKHYDSSLYQSLRNFRPYSFVITDPSLPGHPIVYASDGFLQMCGYPIEEVIGRNPKFLQGPDTDRRCVVEVGDAVREERACRTTLLNYAKDGRPYLVILDLAPVFSHGDGRIVHFVGVQTPVQTQLFSDMLLRCMRSNLSGCGKELLLHSYNSSYTSNRHHDGTSLSKSSIGQKKKKLKIASTVLQLVIHELMSSSRLRNTEVCNCRSICEIPQTTLSSSLTLALSKIQQSFVLCDANHTDMPIVYASDKFLRLTGYQRDDVLGRNCKFLQGSDTDSVTIQKIQDSIRHQQSCTIQILNYRKDRSCFWNLLHISPVRDHRGKVVYFVGVQSDVSACELENGSREVKAPYMHQLGAVGAVKVAIRSLQGSGLRRVLQ